MSEDIIRVLRVIEYVGPRSWVEETVAKSIHGVKVLPNGCEIRASTIGVTADVVGNVEDSDDATR